MKSQSERVQADLCAAPQMTPFKKYLDTWYRDRFASESFVPSLNYLHDMLQDEGIDSEQALVDHIEVGAMDATINRYYEKMQEVGRKQRMHDYIEISDVDE
uniref:Uncharacterized protein n=2 Tax=Vibrio TaxID=662 RepID=A0A0H3ZT23_9VIBR|nr:hypothetical protein [Vibrio cyclitrophicus]AKN38247.1 hypothetical protein [Vibrio splendidus]